MKGLGTTFRNVKFSGELGSNPFSGAGSYEDSTYGSAAKPSIFTAKIPNFKPSYTPPSYTPITYSPAPVFQQQQNGTSLKLNNIFDTSAALLSQFFAKGGNPTTQITNSSAIRAVQPPQGSQQMITPQEAADYAAGQQLALRNNSPGGALGSGVDGIINYALANPLYVFLGIGAVYLLFREPPKGRR